MHILLSALFFLYFFWRKIKKIYSCILIFNSSPYQSYFLHFMNFYNSMNSVYNLISVNRDGVSVTFLQLLHTLLASSSIVSSVYYICTEYRFFQYFIIKSNDPKIATAYKSMSCWMCIFRVIS